MNKEFTSLIDAGLRSDPQAQLVLLLSRERLSAAQLESARRIGADIKDWRALLMLATRKYTVNFVTAHLKELGVFDRHPELAGFAQSLCLQIVAQFLRAKASQKAFHRTCVLPTKAEHLYMKGIPLTEIYYGNGTARFCRDIDIICKESDFGKLIWRALDQGYEYFDTECEPQYAKKKEFLNFAIRHSDVVSLLGRDGILIEVHRSIEKTTAMFSLKEIFADADEVDIGENKIKMMSTAWLFLYICYHHSRHFWSRLHWVADIAAIRNHQSFNEQEVRGLAARIGLLPTLDAVLEFGTMTGEPERWTDASFSGNGSLLLDVCLANLKDDRETEQKLRKEMFLFDMIGDWQLGKGHKAKVWAKSALRRLRPSVSQYLADPKPPSQEWLYTMSNAGALLRNASLHLKVGP
jgi:hypothetical protein